MAVATLAASATGAYGGTFAVFGPERFERGTGAPAAVFRQFTVMDPAAEYFVRIRNGGMPDSNLERVSSAFVALNGLRIAGPQDFNQTVALVEKPVVPGLSNVLTVEVRGKPGGAITLEIIGLDDDPPSIEASVTPPPNEFGWHRSDVAVIFECSDNTSGIAICPEAVVVATEGDGILVTGTAVDRAGNEATAAVMISLDKTPPSIIPTLSPAPNLNGWNNTDVTVGFSCQDALSGVRDCPAGDIVTTEGDGNVVSGTAEDLAGNTAIGSSLVRLDRSAPAVNVTWPPVGEFGTDLSSIEVEGIGWDGLSGVSHVIVRDHNGEEAVPGPQFSSMRALMTDVPQGEKGRDNWIEVEVVDRADNAVAQWLRVRHTMATTTALETDPADFVPAANGVMTSTKRALVRFPSPVSRAAIHEIIRQEGGRVAGHLPALNIALAIFETDGLQQLEQTLASLESREEVTKAIPVTLVDLLQDVTFDNDSLTDADRRAYDSINLRLAANLILHGQRPLTPVRVGIIDTGLHADYGRNDEFAGIHFYDLCTPEGQEGQSSTPNDISVVGKSHGTWVTGIVAGANNGEGNNGVLRGLPGSAFDVHVFKARCFEWADFTGVQVHAALDLIVGGTIGDFDVVNMSLGSYADASYYEEAFTSPGGSRSLWVAAAGNDGIEMSCDDEPTLHYPSGYACGLDNVVSVGSYLSDGPDLDPARALTRAFFSNYGALTLSAPGVFVETAREPGEYARMDPGTSASAPLVTGAAALALAVNRVSPSSLKQYLVQTAQPLNDPELPEGGLDVEALIWEITGGLPGDDCPCFTQEALDAVDWDIWCSGSTLEYLLGDSPAADPAPLAEANPGGSAPYCATGSFYDSTYQQVSQAQAEACAALIVRTGTNQGTRRACRID